MVAKRTAVSLLTDVQNFCQENSVSDDKTVGELVSLLKDEVVKESQSKLASYKSKTTKPKTTEK